jgi:tetratricopeptide (TPR) repeat protein
MALVACRAALAAGCAVAAWRSVRLAMADWVARAGTIDALENAVPYAPDDGRLLARLAIAKANAGDASPAVDAELARAERMDPLNSDVLMARGLRAEFQGDDRQAEKYLLRAVQMDAQFKPAWTLANFYLRTNQTDKSWPMIEHMLNLEPFGYDPALLFELCWRAADGDAQRVQRLIPDRGGRRMQYVGFLVGTERLDAAIAAWPPALKSTDRGDAQDSPALIRFVEAMAGANRTGAAVTAWNELVDRGVVRSGKLDPAKGASVADTDFQFPMNGRGFEWRLAEVAGVSTETVTGKLELETNGDEPEQFQALSTLAPVMPGKRYRLAWKSEGAKLSAPKDPGFSLSVVQQPGNVATVCTALMTSESCEFASLPGDGTGLATIELGYRRAQGTTRVTGTLELWGVHLEPLP